jgi:hypothetical protein
MSGRKDLKRQYKETPRRAGIFVITNTLNGKVFLGSSTNLDGPLNKHRFALKIGRHLNAALQADWNQAGADAFRFEIVDEVQIRDEPGFNLNDELLLLEEIWIEKLQPFGERGYNTGASIRDA